MRSDAFSLMVHLADGVVCLRHGLRALLDLVLLRQHSIRRALHRLRDLCRRLR